MYEKFKQPKRIDGIYSGKLHTKDKVVNFVKRKRKAVNWWGSQK